MFQYAFSGLIAFQVFMAVSITGEKKTRTIFINVNGVIGIGVISIRSVHQYMNVFSSN